MPLWPTLRVSPLGRVWQFLQNKRTGLKQEFLEEMNKTSSNIRLIVLATPLAEIVAIIVLPIHLEQDFPSLNGDKDDRVGQHPQH